MKPKRLSLRALAEYMGVISLCVFDDEQHENSTQNVTQLIPKSSLLLFHLRVVQVALQCDCGRRKETVICSDAASSHQK